MQVTTITRSTTDPLVRAILPLPEGRFMPDSLATAFCARVAGEARPTQTRAVARHHDGSVSVAEVAALAPEGSYTDVTLHLEVPPVLPFEVPDSVQGLMRGLGVLVRTRGASGTQDRFVRFDSLLPQRTPRSGPVLHTVEYAANMDGTAHLSVIAQVTLRSGGEVVGLDLTVHDALAFPQLGDLYFDVLALTTPPGWELEHAWVEPASGPPMPFGRLVAHPLVAASSDGRTHVMLQRQRREWRIALHQARKAEARDWHAWLMGLAWLTSGRIAWRAGTPFGPAGALLPRTAATTPDLRNLTEYLTAFAAGTPIGPGWSQAGRLGPYHPWGPEYGGSTGGTEILQHDGPQMLLDRGEALAARCLMRAVTDRHHVGLYDETGDVPNLDNYSGWSMFSGLFQAGKEGPFRFSAADQSARTAIQAAGLEPTYAAQLRRFQPIDVAHLARRTAHLVGLVWATGDLLAARELALAGELAKAEFRVVPQAPVAVGWGLAGRRLGWAMASVAAAYAIGSDATRARYLPWLDATCQGLQICQMQNGWWQADTTNKPYQTLNLGLAPADRVAAGQAIEHGIQAHGLRCASNVTTGGVAHRDLLLNAALGVWLFWKVGGSGPHGIVAVRPLDASRPCFMSVAEMPAKGDVTDNFQIGSTLAYGLEFADEHEGDELLAAVRKMLGVTSDAAALAKLRSSTRLYHDSWWPLLRMLEEEVEV